MPSRSENDGTGGGWHIHPVIALYPFHHRHVPLDQRKRRGDGIGMIIKIEIYQKSGDAYQLDQTLNQGGPVVSSALSEDGKELLACSTDLNIYRHDGTFFALNQSISMGFQCWAVKYMGNLVMVHGASSEIRFYEFSGSAYALKFTITTG